MERRPKQSQQRKRSSTSRTVTTLVSIASGLMMVGGCGAAVAPSANDPGAAAAASAGDRALLDLDAAVNGTLTQQRDARFLQYVELQQSLSSCYIAHGQVYPVPAFDDVLVGVAGDFPAGPTPASVPVSMDTAKRAGLHVAERELIVWRSQRELNTDVARSEAWLATARQCNDAALSAGHSPAPSALSQAWASTLTDLSRSSGADASLAATYPACMTNAGYKVSSTAELDEAVRAKFVPFGLPDGPAVPGSTEWMDAVAFESAAAVADAGCRADAHSIFAIQAVAVAASFTNQHATDLSSARSDHAATSTKATVLRSTWYAQHPSLPRL